MFNFRRFLPSLLAVTYLKKQIMIKVAFLMLDGAQLLDFAGPHDVLTAANQVLIMRSSRRGRTKGNPYSVSLFSEKPSIEIAGGQNIQLGGATKIDVKRAKFDTVIVVGGQNLDGPISKKSIDWVKNVARSARRVVSICTGAFVLAQAGLLDNRRAATHWLYVQELKKSYPKIEVDGDSIWVKDGNVYTSAGVTAGIDLTLALVEEDHGEKVALAVARGLVVYLRRPGSQSQFSQLLKQQHSNLTGFKEIVPWILENLKKELSVEMLAQKCAMSQRHFARQFGIAFSTTPARLVSKLRLEAAKNLLAESNLSVEQIARECGFSNSDVFRKSFLRALELTPYEYRRFWGSSR